MKNQKYNESMLAISKALDMAKEYKLETELIYSIIKETKANPTQDVEAIVTAASLEWDL